MSDIPFIKRFDSDLDQEEPSQLQLDKFSTENVFHFELAIEKFALNLSQLQLIFKEQFQGTQQMQMTICANQIEIKSHVSLQKINKPFYLFRTIAKYDYNCLECLCLNNCGISSLECLSFVNAPCLKSLDLQMNMIVNLKPLAKTSFSQLESISFYKNRNQIPEISHIGRFKINTEWFFQLNLINTTKKSLSFWSDLMSFGKSQEKTQVSSIQRKHIILLMKIESFQATSIDFVSEKDGMSQKLMRTVYHRFSNGSSLYSGWI